MNAKQLRMIGLAACLPLLSANYSAPAEAAGPLDLVLSTTLLNQVSGSEQLSRNDVDRLLREATAAIDQGKFEEADAILRRTEKAGVHYPLLHMGPTPASVRRALAKAQRAAEPAKPSSTAKPVDPFNRAPGVQTGASRLAASLNSVARNNPSLPSAPSGEPSAPPAGAKQFDPAIYGAQDASAMPSLARPLGNPFEPVATASDAQQDGALPDAPLPTGTPSAPNPPSAIAYSPQSRTLNTPPEAAVHAAPGASAKQQALEKLAAARQALNSGDIAQAEKLAREASALGVPESQFLPTEDRPSQLAWDILRARDTSRAVQNAGATMAADEPRYTATQANASDAPADSAPGAASDSAPTIDPDARYAFAPDQLELPPESSAPGATPVEPAATQPSVAGAPLSPPPSMDAAALIGEAEQALAARDLRRAEELFSQAYLLREQLDPAAQQRLAERLQSIASETAPAAPPRPLASATEAAAPLPPASAGSTQQTAAPPSAAPNNPSASPSMLDSMGEKQLALARQLSAEITKRQTEAIRLREKNPQQALEILRETRKQVEASQVSPAHQRQLLGRLDITIRDTEKHFEDNRAEIELNQQNESIQAEVDRDREVKIQVQNRIAELVDEYNKLKDEQRFAEAEVVARRLLEIAPDEQITQQIWLDSKFIRRTMMNRELADAKERSFWEQANAVEWSAVNPVAKDGAELVFDGKYWDDFVKDRKGLENNRRTERELEIEQRLRTPVQLKYQNTPLSEVVDDLQQLSGVNIHLDPLGLSQEGVHTDTEVTVSLNREVSLKSALHLILEPLHLSYVIKDEVLKITSEQLRDGELKTYTYNVADLVIPIPNFVPSNNIGLQGLINDAHAMSNQSALGIPGPAVLVNDRAGQPRAGTNDNVLAQQIGGGPASTLSPSTIPIGSGPGGMGGAANADFDSLIDLIVSTVSTETWAENGGGEAEIRPFPTNLSLVISQTQAVHEEIADLLAQLRRFQDLQVTIEVRFIRINDSFFERIGVDFDMNIEDRIIADGTIVPGGVIEPGGVRNSATVGLQQPVPPTNPFPNFTADLDIPFRQNSFNATAIPPFGNPVDVASFGFAILSDIEAYFLIEAAQGDRRNNVLNAPKVTLFNGQQAFVADTVQQPFVMGVIPVVGEFAAAQQPVIVVLNEGTMMTIQAVVSDDRRYVRLTVVPFFTQIGDVDEFTFEGSSSTTTSSSTTEDDDDDSNSKEESESNERSGVTVQLPTFQFISVVTTVSVPDGGTVLLGGIKRLSEGRSEIGVPLLSKLPYINRLFKNVAIGRETESLMMMVTPRIIIQEEEEERLGVATATP